MAGEEKIWRLPMGTIAGVAGALTYYALAPMLGRGAMLVAWAALWIVLAVLDGRIVRQGQRPLVQTLVQGATAAVLSGLTFYLVVGALWGRAPASGRNYALQFAMWAIAWAPGILAIAQDLRRGSFSARCPLKPRSPSGTYSPRYPSSCLCRSPTNRGVPDARLQSTKTPLRPLRLPSPRPAREDRDPLVRRRLHRGSFSSLNICPTRLSPLRQSSLSFSSRPRQPFVDIAPFRALRRENPVGPDDELAQLVDDRQFLSVRRPRARLRRQPPPVSLKADCGHGSERSFASSVNDQ